MPLDTEVDLGAGHILLDGVPALRELTHSSSYKKAVSGYFNHF